jgi:hypothetical protein
LFLWAAEACAVAASLTACAPAARDPAPESEAAEERVGRAEQPIVTPAWTDTGPMSVARAEHTATPLPDGRVLVVGGTHTGAVDTGDVFFNTAEIFDPGAGQFAAVSAKMSQRRSGHGAAPLAGGRVLVAGGRGDMQSSTTAEIIDLKFGNKWQPTAPMSHGHVFAAMVPLLDGRVVIIGGQGTGATEIFDPKTGAWTDVAPLATPRSLHTATVLQDGRVLVTGGLDAMGKVLASAEILEPGAGTWSSAPPMATPRVSHAAARLAFGGVLVTGGSTDKAQATAAVELYDPKKKAWFPLPSMAGARAGHTATALANGGVIVSGGIDATGSILRTSELFDPDAITWASVGLLDHGRVGHATVPLAAGALLAVGGRDQSTAEIYRPMENGQQCSLTRQCASGFCVDDVCCNTTCSGMCVTCALPGKEGTCDLAAPGTDPHLDCGKGGPCDDVCGEKGACESRVGQVCVEPACVEDGAKAIVEATCHAAGDACASTTVDCAPYRCGPNGPGGKPGCLAACASIDDCAPGFACDPEGHCRLRPDVAGTDAQGCSASSPEPPLSAGGAAAWLAGIGLAVAARRARRRRS